MKRTPCLRGSKRRLPGFLVLAALAAGVVFGPLTGHAKQSVCPKTATYWDRYPERWPQTSMTLGKQRYSETVLIALMKSERFWDASMILARQLITARLNIANGVAATPVAETITDADRLLSAYSKTLPFYVGIDSPAGEQMVSFAKVLNNYNYGLLTTGCAH